MTAFAVHVTLKIQDVLIEESFEVFYFEGERHVIGKVSHLMDRLVLNFLSIFDHSLDVITANMAKLARQQIDLQWDKHM